MRRLAAAFAPSCLALVIGLSHLSGAGAMPLVSVSPDPVGAGGSATISFNCPSVGSELAPIQPLGSWVDISSSDHSATPTSTSGGHEQQVTWNVPDDWPGGTATVSANCLYDGPVLPPLEASVEVVAATTTSTEAPTPTTEESTTTTVESTTTTLPITTAATSPDVTDQQLQVSDPTPHPLGQLTLTAVGYAPTTPVTFTIHSDPMLLGTVDANESGVATLVVSLPEGLELGGHTVSSSGVDPAGATRVLAQQITLVAVPTPAPLLGAAPSDLPRTGGSPGVLLETGVGLLLLGAAALLIRRQAPDRS